MKQNRKLLLLVLVGSLGFLLAAGCASLDRSRKKEAAYVVPPPVDKPPYLFHRVVEGETLAGIARWYSGDETTLERLQEENPTLDPVKLNQGDIVKVPVFLAVVHNEPPDGSTEPQKPQKAVRKKSGKVTKPVLRPAPQAAPEVFGPK